MLREVFLRVLRFSPLLKNQHFQIPIRSGMHGHVSTSSYELLSDPWVNKLQFFYNLNKLQFTIFFRAKSGYFATDKPNSRFRGKQSMVRGVCFTFNAGRPCAGCRYNHKCSKCGGRHAARVRPVNLAQTFPNQPEIELSQLHHIINSPPVTPVKVSTLSPLLQ